jgi:hypothetical protein
MNEMFTKAMVASSAVATFVGVVGIVASSVISLVDSRVDTVVQTKYTAPAKEAESEQPSALVQQTGKLLKQLLK